MKKKYPNLMMQSASNYDSSKIKEAAISQIKEEQNAASISSNNIEAATSTQPEQNMTASGQDITTSTSMMTGVPTETNIPVATPDPFVTPVIPVTAITPAAPSVQTKVAKPRLRQQAYYLTEQEIKTIKRLSYELDIPKSDLVRKFIDEGIARIDNKSDN